MKREIRFMRFILIILITVILSSCNDNMTGPIKGGTIITLEEDTIEFYGGYMTHKDLKGLRSIVDVAIDDLNQKGD